MLKHWSQYHDVTLKKPCFSMKIMRAHTSALYRQVHEAVLIDRTDRTGNNCILNSKTEYNRCSLPRLTVKVGERDVTTTNHDAKLSEDDILKVMDEENSRKRTNEDHSTGNMPYKKRKFKVRPAVKTKVVKRGRIEEDEISKGREKRQKKSEDLSSNENNQAVNFDEKLDENERIDKELAKTIIFEKSQKHANLENVEMDKTDEKLFPIFKKRDFSRRCQVKNAQVHETRVGLESRGGVEQFPKKNKLSRKKPSTAKSQGTNKTSQSGAIMKYLTPAYTHTGREKKVIKPGSEQQESSSQYLSIQ